MSQSQELVGCKCWFCDWDKALGVWGWRRGSLVFWSTDNADGLPFPVGVVYDDETERTESVHVDRISFATTKPDR